MSEVKLNTHISAVGAARGSAPATSSAGRSETAPAQTERASVGRLPQQTIEEVAQRIDSYLRSVGRSIEFSIDADSGRTVIMVRDKETGELIRQIPNEEALRLAEMAADETIVLVNETV
jgi:flagellar protein FlaG